MSDICDRLISSFKHLHDLELLPSLLDDAPTLERAFNQVVVDYRLDEDFEMFQGGGGWWDWCYEMYLDDSQVFTSFSLDIAKESVKTLYEEGGVSLLCEYIQRRGKIISIVEESGRVKELDIIL